MKFAAILSAVLVVVGRLLIVPRLDLPTAEGCYESFAHLYVGGLFGYAIGVKRWPWALMAIGLSLFELVCFLVQKGIS